MTRFFVASDLLSQDIIRLEGENAAHAKVLRLKNGEQVLVCDGDGAECLCEVMVSNGSYYDLAVVKRGASQSEAKIRASIYMALPKADKLEHVIQKATELGAYEVVTFPTARCISRPDDKSLKKKLERWKKLPHLLLSSAEGAGSRRWLCWIATRRPLSELHRRILL